MPDGDRDTGRLSLKGKKPKLRDRFLSSNEAGHTGCENITRLYCLFGDSDDGGHSLLEAIVCEDYIHGILFSDEVASLFVR